MWLQVVAGLLKSRIQKKMLEQAWPQAEVAWGVPLEEVTLRSTPAGQGLVLVCIHDVDQDQLRQWLEGNMRRATDCAVFLVVQEGGEEPEWLPMLEGVHILHEPLDIHLMKNILHEKAPSSAAE